MTAEDLIASSLRKINYLGSGETATASDAADCLVIVNDMLDSWSADRLNIFTVARQVFTLTAGQQTRTLGTGGQFNVARPPKIERAGIIVNSVEYPCAYFTNSDQWAEIPDKTTSSAIPYKIWDDDGFPLRTLSFYPLPSDSTVQVALYTWTALSQFADLVTDYTFPPGYREAIKLNLAVALCPEFAPLDPLIAAQALAAKMNIQSKNLPVLEMKCDPCFLTQGWASIYTGGL